MCCNMLTKKRNKGFLNDVTIEVGDHTIAANRIILSCCSRFLEAMFDLEMKEKYQNPVQIHGVDGAAVKSVVDFMYNGEVKITSENVMELIAASDYLQVAEVKRFCFEFLESILSSDNWFAVYSAAKLYASEHLRNQVYEYISNNFDDVIQTDKFRSLPKNELVCLVLKVNKKQVNEESIFNGIVTWCRQNEEDRKENFSELFEKLIDLDEISADFLEKNVLEEEMVNGSIHCLKLVTNHLCQEKRFRRERKIISLGGAKSLQSCIEVFSLSTEPQNFFPDLPIKLNSHCSLRLGDYIYLIGGESSFGDDKNTEISHIVWQLNVSDKVLKWKEKNHLNKKRFVIGGTVFRDALVVLLVDMTETIF